MRSHFPSLARGPQARIAQRRLHGLPTRLSVGVLTRRRRSDQLEPCGASRLPDDSSGGTRRAGFREHGPGVSGPGSFCAICQVQNAHAQSGFVDPVWRLHCSGVLPGREDHLFLTLPITFTPGNSESGGSTDSRSTYCKNTLFCPLSSSATVLATIARTTHS